MNYDLSPGISVIICCYNSAERIIQVLERLAHQQFSSTYEVILVDNNCTDNTVSLAVTYWKQQNTSVPFQIISEKKPGLNYARRAGIMQAQKSIVLLCDDDNLLNVNYLQIAFDTMQSDLTIGAAGGFGNAVISESAPDWFEAYKGAYACGPQNENSGYVTKTRGYLYGAALCIRTNVIRDILTSNRLELTDRSGLKLVSGGDSEICMLIALAGYELYYNAHMQFQHLIGQNRVTLVYLHKLYESFGASYVRLHALEKQLGIGVNKNKTISGIVFLNWKKEFVNMLRYFIKGPVFQGTVNSAWLWGLTKCTFVKMINYQKSYPNTE